MNLFSVEQARALVRDYLEDYRRQGERANIPRAMLADLTGMSRQAFYRWIRNDYRGGMDTRHFLNMLIARGAIIDAIAEGRLPASSRHEARMFVDDLLGENTENKKAPE